jgi:pimeloyl-ACP methyl ester carboxylesterase
MDNAASFDLLVPLLKNASVFAVDLPGHGLSSWIPNGIPYNEDHSIITLRAIVDYFGWKKIKLLGHSMGALISNTYAQYFPKEIKFIISVDALAHLSFDIVQHTHYRSMAVTEYLKMEKKGLDRKPRYSKDEAMQRWINGNASSNLDSYTTGILMSRGTKKEADGKYSFTRDYRLSIRFFPFYTNETIREANKVITCPYLVLKSYQSPFNSDNYWNNVAGILSKSSSNFKLKVLKGCHHMHLTQPQMVADEINPFLEKYDK